MSLLTRMLHHFLLSSHLMTVYKGMHYSLNFACDSVILNSRNCQFMNSRQTIFFSFVISSCHALVSHMQNYSYTRGTVCSWLLVAPTWAQVYTWFFFYYFLTCRRISVGQAQFIEHLMVNLVAPLTDHHALLNDFSLTDFPLTDIY